MPEAGPEGALTAQRRTPALDSRLAVSCRPIKPILTARSPGAARDRDGGRRPNRISLSRTGKPFAALPRMRRIARRRLFSGAQRKACRPFEPSDQLVAPTGRADERLAILFAGAKGISQNG